MNIKPDVRTNHLSQFPSEEDWLKAFFAAFEVGWARRRKAYNTELSVYFLKPRSNIQEQFGFEQELMLVYSPYPNLEPRSLQAAEQILLGDPARGRVERLTYLVVSDMPSAAEWVANYVAANQEARLIAGFSTNDLVANAGDAWFVRNELRKQFFSRDLFDFRLPLESDTYFFGRDGEVLAYRDAIRRGENRGLFGLRKTGKTSVLFKVERLSKKEEAAQVVYLDLETPALRSLRWYELIAEITEQLAGNRRQVQSPAQAAKQFETVVKKAAGRRLVLIFDEVEYISPLAKLDPHWEVDFTSFWQTIRACQSRNRHLSFILAGVNPSVTETSIYNEVQNPLFGIVSPQVRVHGAILQEESHGMRG